jgi:hypothetical protein
MTPFGSEPVAVRAGGRIPSFLDCALPDIVENDRAIALV